MKKRNLTRNYITKDVYPAKVSRGCSITVLTMWSCRLEMSNNCGNFNKCQNKRIVVLVSATNVSKNTSRLVEALEEQFYDCYYIRNTSFILISLSSCIFPQFHFALHIYIVVYISPVWFTYVKVSWRILFINGTNCIYTFQELIEENLHKGCSRWCG